LLRFLHPRSSRLRRNHPPLYSLECWPSSYKVSPSIMNILRCRRLNHWGAWISPQFDLLLLFPSSLLSRSLNGAASVLGLVSVFNAIFSSLRALLIVFICLLCHNSPPPPTTYLPTHLPTTNVHAEVFAFTAAARCLHHHSHDNPITQRPSFNTYQTPLKYTHNRLNPALFSPPVCSRLSHSGHLRFLTRVTVTCSHLNSANPSDCRRDQ
jgi:hypothetical protein